MAKTIYTERPHQVDAEQFLANKPWPALVDDCGQIAGPHLHLDLASGLGSALTPIADTDWVVYDGPSVLVLTDADFDAAYVKKTGP